MLFALHAKSNTIALFYVLTFCIKYVYIPHKQKFIKMKRNILYVGLLGMKFAVGEKAVCINTDSGRHLKVGNEYNIKGNAGVDPKKPDSITEYIEIAIDALEHKNGLLPEEIEKGTVAFKTVYFNYAEPTNMINVQ
jgi:hypothetical protein